MESEKLCLQWTDFQTNVNLAFQSLRGGDDFNDVTLACEDGTQVEAHKFVLATSSPVLKNLLKRNKHNHPLIYMRGMKSHDLLAMVDFIYCGEAKVFQENLDSFLAFAEELQLKGLMEKSDVKLDRELIPTKKPENPTEVDIKMEMVNVQASIAESNKVAIKGDISGDISQLDEQIKSLMEVTQNLVSSGKYKFRGHICKICGKEGMKNDIKKHIEANHLEGLSFPCKLCEKSCRSRNTFWTQKNNNHGFL